MEKAIDLTDKSLAEETAMLNETLKGLKTNEQALFEGKSDFDALLSLFQNDHWGSFEWLPVAKDNEKWSGYLVSKSGDFKGIQQIMESHHRFCDTSYINAENELSGGDKELGKVLMKSFLWNMELHFTREEEVLFPAFEEKTGMVGGPTEVMRAEHQQIRGVLKEISDCLNNDDVQRIIDLSETMLILVQQHNSKEENMLYPMTDQHLAEVAEPTAKKLQLFIK